MASTPRQPTHYLPAALRNQAPDTAATDALWSRYADGDEAAFSPLVAHFAPQAFIVACQLKRRRPDFYAEPLDVLTSDGQLGLIRAMRSTRCFHSGFRTYARTAVRHAIRRGVFDRRWGGRYQAERQGIVEEQRSRLVQEHGRLPTRAEMAAALRGIVLNPALHVDGEPAMEPLSASARAVADPGAPRPDAEALGREAVRLAMKGLRPADRQILGLVMEGHGPKRVAAELGVSENTAARRINGVLWEARSRADLAAHLGTEPVQRPPVKHGWKSGWKSSGPAVPLERRFQSGRPLDARQRRALELLANGLTPAAVAREIGTARETVGAWKNHHPEFVAALARRAV